MSGERALLYGHDRWFAKQAPHRLHIVEGLLNTCELESAGVRDVCALGGTHFSPEAQLALLDVGVKEVCVVFDGDAGGVDGARLLARQLRDRPTGLSIDIKFAAKGNPTLADYERTTKQ